MCHLYLEAVAVKHIMQSKHLSIQEKLMIVRLQKQIHQRERESRDIRSQINSLMHSERKKTALVRSET